MTLWILTFWLALGTAKAGPIELLTFREHSRLTFRVDDGVEVQWKDIPGGFQLVLKAVGASDLGAPLGAEDEWMRAQEAEIRRGDARLASLSLTETQEGFKVVGKWKFAGGDAAPADQLMERFEYREKDPARLVVDFWPKQGPTVAEVRSRHIREERAEAARKSTEAAERRKERKLASLKVRTAAEDTTRFCHLPLSGERDAILPLLPVHGKTEFSRWFPATTPDSNYQWRDPQSGAKDAKYLRLALQLYRQGKPALVTRTLDFLVAEHPKSEYEAESSFLRASAMVRLGYATEAQRILSELVKNYPTHPVALHAAMFLSVREMEQNSHLSALEKFLWMATRHPEHRLAWVFHLGAGEALYSMKQTERAAKEFQWVIENAPDDVARAEGAARMGDLYLARQQYERALGSYFQAINYFGKEIQRFPAVMVNRAESLYWLGQYDRADEVFRKFLDENSSHPGGWRAAYRLGEIFGRKDGDVALAESRKWYYETINRFPMSPGATLARLRLLPCGDHGGFDLATSQRFFSGEAANFDGAGEVVMARFKDFRGLTQVRTLMMLGRTDLAVTAAIGELQRNPMVADLLGTIFRRTILKMLEDGKQYEALSFYNEKIAAIPSRLRPLLESVDPEFLLKLSQAASDLGLGTMANGLVAAHAKAVAVAEKGARVVAAEPAAPSVDDELEAKLKASERAYTEAKAIFVAGGDVVEIRSKLASVIEESEFSFEREVILGLLDERAQKTASALSHALRAQLLRTTSKTRPTVAEAERIEYWVARLQHLAGDSRAAVSSYRKLQQGKKDGEPAALTEPGDRTAPLGVSAVPVREALVIAEGELLTQSARWGEAAEAWARAMDGGAGNHALYEYAKALGHTGRRPDKDKSREAMRKLAASAQDDFWRKLAREALARQSDSKRQQ